MERINLAVIGLVLILLVPIVIGVSLKVIHNQGKITAPANLIGTEMIDWGDLTQGLNITNTRAISLTNIGQQPTKPLDITVQWITQQIGTVSWNGFGSVIAPSDTKNYLVTLTITNTTFLGSFDFDITIIEV